MSKPGESVLYDNLKMAGAQILLLKGNFDLVNGKFVLCYIIVRFFCLSLSYFLRKSLHIWKILISKTFFRDLNSGKISNLFSFLMHPV